MDWTSVTGSIHRKLAYELEEIRSVYGLEADGKKADNGRITENSCQLPGIGSCRVSNPVGDGLLY